MSRYQITVLELGYDPKFPAGIAFDFWNMGDDQIYSKFSMTLLQGQGHNILFDCGFDPALPFAAGKILQEGDQNCHDPKSVLESIGVSAEDIDSVVLSHAHWDHMSGMQFFPKARFYIQRAEYEGWRSAFESSLFPATHKMVVNPENLRLLEALDRQGRVVWLEGDQEELFPGIRLRTASGHSFAQSMLFIENEGARYAIIGDVSMRPESFAGTEAFSCYLPNLKFSVGTIDSIMKSYRQIIEWVNGDISHIVMTHDSSIFEKWPTTVSGLGLHVTKIGAAG